MKDKEEFLEEGKLYPKTVEINENSVAINLSVDTLNPDRVQYKPYGVGYYSSGLYVQVILPKKEIVHMTPDYVILTPKGIAIVADTMATAIDEVHDDWRSRSRRL